MFTKEIKYGKNIQTKIFFVKKLDELGISKKYLGYFLLVEIMEILINQNKKIISFSKEVYPQIALKYGKTVCTIERNIRNLIDKCWNEEMMEKLNVYYVENKKPTCREFVYLDKNYITKTIK